MIPYDLYSFRSERFIFYYYYTEYFEQLGNYFINIIVAFRLGFGRKPSE